MKTRKIKGLMENYFGLRVASNTQPKNEIHNQESSNILLCSEENLDQDINLQKRLEKIKKQTSIGGACATKSFKEKETHKIQNIYLDELMTHEINKNSKKFRHKFLNSHRISAEVRVRMVCPYFLQLSSS